MIAFGLLFVTGLATISGRATDRLNSNAVLEWPLEENTFSLPRILNADETINITIKANTTAEEIEISLMTHDKSVVCSFTMYVSKNSAKVTLTEKSQTESIDLEPVSDLTDTALEIAFKRRRNTEGADNVLQILCQTELKEFETNLLNDMRYIKFTGENARLSNIGFEFK